MVESKRNRFHRAMNFLNYRDYILSYEYYISNSVQWKSENTIDSVTI